MVEIIAFIGIMCLILACAVTLLLPVALAIWVAPIWLVLYLVYAIFLLIIGFIISSYAEKHGKPGESR